MASFLSDEWFSQMRSKLLPIKLLADAAKGFEEPVEPIVIQHLVKDAPDSRGTIGYFVKVCKDCIDIQKGRAADPDVWMTTSYSVASALAKGEIDPYQALLEGLIKMRGNLSLLIKINNLITKAHATS